MILSMTSKQALCVVCTFVFPHATFTPAVGLVLQVKRAGELEWTIHFAQSKRCVWPCVCKRALCWMLLVCICPVPEMNDKFLAFDFATLLDRLAYFIPRPPTLHMCTYDLVSSASPRYAFEISTLLSIFTAKLPCIDHQNRCH